MSPEFWAAIAGAIVGSIAAGGISIALQFWQYRRERQSQDQSMAWRIFFKLFQLEQDFAAIQNHIASCDEYAKSKGIRIGWQSLTAPVNVPAKIRFSPDELSLLFSFDNLELFGMVAQVEAAHVAIVDLQLLYVQRRENLIDRIPAAMDGRVASVNFTDEDVQRFGPLVAEVDDMGRQMRTVAEDNANEAHRVLVAFGKASIAALGSQFKLPGRANRTPQPST